MVCFQTKSTNLGKFWRALDWKMFIYFTAIWNILRTLGIFYDYLVHFVFIWYIFSGLGICTKKNLATLVDRSPRQKAQFEIKKAPFYRLLRCNVGKALL
jgi:hypothetical protein